MKIKIEKPKCGLSKKCDELLADALGIRFQSELKLYERFWLFHNIISRAYQLGIEKGQRKKQYEKNTKTRNK